MPLEPRRFDADADVRAAYQRDTCGDLRRDTDALVFREGGELVGYTVFARGGAAPRPL